MKTLFSTIALVAFSALMLSPTLPADYPPKKVVEQRKEITCKERELNNLINTIECQLDSVVVKNNLKHGK